MQGQDRDHDMMLSALESHRWQLMREIADRCDELGRGVVRDFELPRMEDIEEVQGE